jgi:pyruvate dehydrogenase E2 component (dihydrolipoamide acetyltransferase)
VTRVALEIPKVGLVMENARLIRWLKNVGDVVAQGEPLLELETEKSVVEIESTESGRLVEILMQADQEARVGDRIAWVENDTVAAVSEADTETAPTLAAAANISTPNTPRAYRASNTGRIMSSPVARRIAAAHAVDLRQIAGTGPRGRVQLIDVQRAIESRSVPEASAGAVSDPRPLSGMRRALARSMTLSNATVPQFAVERAVDWTLVHQLRAALPARAQIPSINDFILQATARTLLAFPTLNATFSGDADSPDATIVPVSGAHIGLVVAVENGLLVPVLHGVERLGLNELTRRRRATVERALAGTLKREELEGATISVSNLGARGPDRFNALISPPQSAILAVGRQAERVVALNGVIQVRPISQLTLTVDHRVADGRLASDFLAFLVDILEGDAWRMD